MGNEVSIHGGCLKAGSGGICFHNVLRFCEQEVKSRGRYAQDLDALLAQVWAHLTKPIDRS